MKNNNVDKLKNLWKYLLCTSCCIMMAAGEYYIFTGREVVLPRGVYLAS